MDQHTLKTIDLQLEKLKKICLQNQYAIDIVDTKEDAKDLVDKMIQANTTCSVGGSMTLYETGIIELLENRKDITYYDRHHTDDVRNVFIQAYNSDLYLTSTNALTLKGELYNMDANGNRVSCMVYGPKKVVVVLGLNKIVETIEQAQSRMKNFTAPANNIRLNRPNPCTQLGFCCDCKVPSRLCCSEVIIRHSPVKDRIHLIIVKETLGY